VPIAFITNVAVAEVSVITILASLSVLFFEINPVQASVSDLDNIKPTDPIELASV
jgi:anaerobic C4-dicarboxylate transporter